MPTLAADTFYRVTLHPFVHNSWVGLSPHPKLRPPLVQHLVELAHEVQGTTVVLRSAGDTDESTAHVFVMCGATEEQETFLPQAVFATATELTKSTFTADTSLPGEVVKLADGSTVWWLQNRLHRLDASNTAAVAATIA